MPTSHLLIKGKVQGVYFRATAREVAEKLGVTGWIKNTEEGHVEARVSGTASQLTEFITWCQQGPPAARVTNVDVAEIAEEAFPDFRVIRR